MQTLLSEPIKHYSVLSDPTMERLMKQQRRSIDTLVKSYHTLGTAVNGSHLLVKVLNSLTLNIDSDPVTVYSQTQDNYISVANAVGITTLTNQADPVKGLFYDKSYDYLICDNRMSIAEVLTVDADNWVDLQPVQVKYQPYILPLWHMPKGGKEKAKYFSVIGIDIPGLMVMYAGWYQTNLKRELGSRETVEQFVGRYVLPGMLYSQQDVSNWNRLADLYTEDEIERLDSSPLIHVTDYDDEISQRIEKMGDKIILRDMYPQDIPTNFTSVNTDKTLYEALPNIDIADTQASYPVVSLAWAPYVNLLLIMSLSNTHKGKLAILAKRMVRRVRGQKVLNKLKPLNVRELFSMYYINIRQLLL